MSIEVILKSLQEAPADGLVYLAEPIDEESGFFVCDNELLYASLTNEADERSSISTQHLSLNTKVDLQAIDGSGRYQNGAYDIVRMISDVSTREIESFVNICKSYSANRSNLGFSDFFFSLVSLFRDAKEQSKKNSVGLFGELSFIEFILQEYNIDISNRWQKSGQNSKYDFTLDCINIEVKSSRTNESILTIKHEQLFNDDKNYLYFIRLDRNPSGRSLKELISDLKSVGCLETLHSQITLERELLRIDPSDMEESYTSTGRLYDVEELLFFDEINERISSLSYRLDISGITQTSFEAIRAELI